MERCKAPDAPLVPTGDGGQRARAALPQGGLAGDRVRQRFRPRSYAVRATDCRPVRYMACPDTSPAGSRAAATGQGFPAFGSYPIRANILPDFAESSWASDDRRPVFPPGPAAVFACRFDDRRRPGVFARPGRSGRPAVAMPPAAVAKRRPAAPGHQCRGGRGWTVQGWKRG